MSVEQFEAPETCIFDEMDVIAFHTGDPMWSSQDQNGMGQYTMQQVNNESVHDEEATNPLPDTVSAPNFLCNNSQCSDSDLNNITPSIAPIMFPRMKTGPPTRSSYKGPYEFGVMINGAHTHKKKFLWSTKLQRMYVDAECDFPLIFSWSAGAPQPAFVRAVVVFRDEDQSQHRVETCVNHKSILMTKNLPDCQLRNVLHSSREPGAADVQYSGGADEWYSTVVRFDNGLSTTHAYRFICKNSCTGGINRRAISIIFTLENLSGTVLGREKMSVRVCACPRRDMRAEEGAAPARRRPADARAAEHKPKKVKIEITDTDDDKIVVLPELRVRGISTAITTLEMMREFTVQHKRLSTDLRVLDEDASIIADLDTKLNELRSSK
ncbi:tumor protein 63 [Plodia interpunctella]|uniref:tumor protein 63 n=1 Tax=Plodia interpunctella TaxID=58824 RepID=UPI002367DE1F|nr:tumor protein 63 [Plodia interpunctella]